MAIKMTNSIRQGDGSLKHNTDKNYREQKLGYSEADNIVFLNGTQAELERTYKELFSDSLQEYNEKQKRKDRRIDNYYEHITNGKQEKPFYELVIACGNLDDNPNDGELQVKMLEEIHHRIVTENKYPNLKFFGSAIHLDEVGVPHLHLDYVPFCTNNKRGLSTKTSWTGALREMGFTEEKPKFHETYFDKHGNEKEKSARLFNALRNNISDLCEEVYKEHDVELIALDIKGKQVHEHVSEYKEKKVFEKAVKELIDNPTPAVLSEIIEKQAKELKVNSTPYTPIDIKDITPYEAHRLGKKEAREELKTKISEVEKLSKDNKKLAQENNTMKEVFSFAKNTKQWETINDIKIKELENENGILKSELDNLKERYGRLETTFHYFIQKVQFLFSTCLQMFTPKQEEQKPSIIQQIKDITIKENKESKDEKETEKTTDEVIEDTENEIDILLIQEQEREKEARRQARKERGYDLDR